jgi:hypothetical protein
MFAPHRKPTTALSLPILFYFTPFTPKQRAQRMHTLATGEVTSGIDISRASVVELDAQPRRAWASPGRDIPALTSHTEVTMPVSVSQSERESSWTKLQLESIKSLSEVEELTSLDRDTLVRVYPDFLVRLSPKRLGMKFRNVLKIMNGDAAAA